MVTLLRQIRRSGGTASSIWSDRPGWAFRALQSRLGMHNDAAHREASRVLIAPCGLRDQTAESDDAGTPIPQRAKTIPDGSGQRTGFATLSLSVRSSGQ